MMEIEAATEAMGWLTEQGQRVVMVTDSQSMLRKVETGQLCREWADLLMHSRIDQITWIYCPGHAGVMGNEQANRLAGRAPIEGVLKWDKSVLVMAVRDVSNREEMLARENDPHIIRLREWGVKQGEVRISMLSRRH
jgi:hypothetical protein